MKINTKKKILKLLDKKDYRVSDLVAIFGFSNQIIHRHFNVI